MSRWERHPSSDGTPSRDYTYSQWHRLALPDHCLMIDIDALEYCRGCSQGPVLLVETAQDVGQDNKPVTVMRQLAVMAHLPAIVVLYSGTGPCDCTRYEVDRTCSHGIDQVRVKRILPIKDNEWQTMSGEELRQLVESYHDEHWKNIHSSSKDDS